MANLLCTTFQLWFSFLGNGSSQKEISDRHTIYTVLISGNFACHFEKTCVKAIRITFYLYLWGFLIYLKRHKTYFYWDKKSKYRQDFSQQQHWKISHKQSYINLSENPWHYLDASCVAHYSQFGWCARSTVEEGSPLTTFIPMCSNCELRLWDLKLNIYAPSERRKDLLSVFYPFYLGSLSLSGAVLGILISAVREFCSSMFFCLLLTNACMKLYFDNAFLGKLAWNSAWFSVSRLIHIT